MRKTLFYTTVNAGDGSYYTRFFDSEECVNLLAEHDPEAYSDGDGGPAESFEVVIDGTFEFSEVFPDLKISTLEQVKAEIADID